MKKEYESDGEQRKKIVELGPRKFEGIGPTTKEGIPIVLRSVSLNFQSNFHSFNKHDFICSRK